MCSEGELGAVMDLFSRVSGLGASKSSECLRARASGWKVGEREERRSCEWRRFEDGYIVLPSCLDEPLVCRRSVEGRLLPWCDRECFREDAMLLSSRVAAFRLLRLFFSPNS